VSAGDRPPRHSLAATFGHAFDGLAHLIRTQRTARIEIGIAVAAVLAAIWLGLDAAGWAVLFLTIAVVLLLEGLNTAIELVVDLASPRIHPYAKAAKDLAAGMVLLSALASIAVGIALFGPAIARRLF
jgi:diacylglycerol kinase